jgi:prepilin-type N-terminal cleavage/methylation domain-containing protein
MNRGSQGFSLLELVVVLAILGIVAVVAVPAFTGAAVATPRERAASEVSRALESARAAAARSGAIAHARIVDEGTAIEGPRGRTQLEPGTRIEAEPGETEVVFYPNGLASGARWLVRAAGEPPVMIEVATLAGTIDISYDDVRYETGATP